MSSSQSMHYHRSPTTVALPADHRAYPLRLCCCLWLCAVTKSPPLPSASSPLLPLSTSDSTPASSGRTKCPPTMPTSPQSLRSHYTPLASCTSHTPPSSDFCCPSAKTRTWQCWISSQAECAAPIAVGHAGMAAAQAALASLVYDDEEEKVFIGTFANAIYIYTLPPNSQPLLLHVLHGPHRTRHSTALPCAGPLSVHRQL